MSSKMRKKTANYWYDRGYKLGSNFPYMGSARNIKNEPFEKGFQAGLKEYQLTKLILKE